MRILVTGAGGMLAADLLAASTAHELVGVSRTELDVTDRAACIRAAEGFDAIINCAAYTNVDAAESDEDAAYAVNALGAENLAAAAASTGAVLVQISTDYVFDGTATMPYDENAPLSPLGAYGRTKAAGEQLAVTANPDTVIVRVAWLYGMHGGNFVQTMLRLAGERETVSVVTDQVGQPTSTVEAAETVLALLDAGVRSGTFHGTCAGEVSWWEFAREIFTLAGLDADRVHTTTSAEFVRPAPRPAYSVLGHTQIQQVRSPRIWKDALRDELRRMGRLTP